MSDLTYEAAIAKGKKLLAMMCANDKEAGQMFNPPRDSAASDIEEADIERSGYRLTFDSADTLDSYVDLLESLGGDTEHVEYGGTNEERSYHHARETIRDGKKCPVTDAIFDNVVNLKAGMLIATSNSSPWYITKVKKEVTGEADEAVLPRLQHWSDMAYLQWKYPLFQEPQSNLRYVLRGVISNKDTAAIIGQILDIDAKCKTIPQPRPEDWVARPRWPGIEFGIDDERAQALLGTPNGSGVGWLLTQHKHGLGHKVVDKVSVFFSELKESEVPNLLFHIKDYEGQDLGNACVVG